MTFSPQTQGERGASLAHHIVLFSCYYGASEPFNPDVFGPALGHFPCFIFSDDLTLPVPDGVTLVHDPLLGLDPNRASRRAKLMPDRYLPSTTWSIYVDNNARLIADPKDLVTHTTLLGNYAIYAIRHPHRSCCYAEAKVCKLTQKDTVERIDGQMIHYSNLGFRKNAGLLHGAFLIRNHNHPKLAALGQVWFEHVLRYSRRDQLSFAFVAEALNVEPCYMDNALNGSAMFQWPIHIDDNRRDKWKRSYWKRVIKPFLRKLRNKPSNTEQLS